MRWFNIALVGWILLIVALAVAAHLMGAPPIWIGIGALALIGMAVIMSANRSGTPDNRNPDGR
ncbi:MAG: hypothetical protein KY432_04580 [Acidobacteria bacterium]|nr:hypothetical protein [Acidobacteriota bacterium]